MNPIHKKSSRPNSRHKMTPRLWVASSNRKNLHDNRSNVNQGRPRMSHRFTTNGMTLKVEMVTSELRRDLDWNMKYF